MSRTSVWLGAVMSILAINGVSAGAQAPPTRADDEALTIDRAVREALDHNLSLAAQRYDLGAADASIATASLRPNPVVTFDVMRADSALLQAGISPNEEVIRTDYVIEGGGKRQHRVETATLARSVAESQLLDATRTLALDVENAFIDVQLAKQNLALARENLDAFNSLVTVNAERVRTGDLAGVELARSQLARLQFQNEVRQQESSLRIARNRLGTLIGRDPASAAVDVTGDLRREQQPVQLEEVRARAFASRPDLQALRMEQARSAADLRLQIANGRVDYTVSGEYHKQQGEVVRGNTFGVFVSAPLPVFNRNQGEIARARTQGLQTDARIRAFEAEISKELTAAYDEYVTARDIVATSEQQMITEARNVRASVEYSYRAGEASLIELLDAVRAFNDTMQGYNEARASYARSLYTLDAVSGRVSP